MQQGDKLSSTPEFTGVSELPECMQVGRVTFDPKERAREYGAIIVPPTCSFHAYGEREKFMDELAAKVAKMVVSMTTGGCGKKPDDCCQTPPSLELRRAGP